MNFPGCCCFWLLDLVFVIHVSGNQSQAKCYKLRPITFTSTLTVPDITNFAKCNNKFFLGYVKESSKWDIACIVILVCTIYRLCSKVRWFPGSYPWEDRYIVSKICNNLTYTMAIRQSVSPPPSPPPPLPPENASTTLNTNDIVLWSSFVNDYYYSTSI